MPSAKMETSLNDADFTKLRAIIHKQTGITIAENRRSMLFSRLRRRLRETELNTFSDYISKVSSDPKEMQELTNQVTTNETYFYRTPRVWQHLREVTVPQFLSASTSRAMKIWSAAASTGEEGHTVGVVLEDVRQSNPGFDYTVLGTDISSRVLALAEDGLYVGRRVARFQQHDPELFSKYMVGNDTDGFRVLPEIKRRISFRLHNLLEPLKSAGPFDVVFLRNVLIYFVDADQEKILAHVYNQLRPDGTLIIGESETLKNLNCSFEQTAPLIYRPVLKTKPGVPQS
ncbi:MAG: protein-glutamate O-methyltransferase CheR [Pseudomonadota bacterium]